jgi:hypothetical protein
MGEHLLSKCNTLNSIPRTTKRENERKNVVGALGHVECTFVLILVDGGADGTSHQAKLLS